MGYRSHVAFSVEEQEFKAWLKKLSSKERKSVIELLSYCIHNDKTDTTFYYTYKMIDVPLFLESPSVYYLFEFEDIKWSFDKTKNLLEKYVIESLYSYFVRMGEDYSDTKEYGDYRNNKFGININHYLSIDGVDTDVEELSVSQICRKTHMQNCHYCEDTSCGDNTNPEYKK